MRGWLCGLTQLSLLWGRGMILATSSTISILFLFYLPPTRFDGLGAVARRLLTLVNLVERLRAVPLVAELSVRNLG